MTLTELTTYTFNLIEKLAFPRLTGSSGAKKVLGLIDTEFRNAGFKTIHREQFKTSFYNWSYITAAFVVSGVLLVLLSYTSFEHPYISLGIISLVALAGLKTLLLFTSGKTLLWKNDKKNIEAENIYVTLKGEKARAHIVLLAHWDSKSQLFPSTIRALIFIASFLGYGFLFFLYTIISLNSILALVDLSFLSPLAPLASGAMLLLGLLNLAGKPGNNSPGALDNAQSLASIIALARHFHKAPPSNLDFTFLSTGSEELNLGGSIDYINRHQDEFTGIPTYFINLDGVGCHGTIRLVSSYGIPRKFTSKKLNELFSGCARQLNIPLKNFYIPTGAWADHIPIIRKGFEATWLTSEKGFNYFHTPRDDMSLITPEKTEEILKLCLAVIDSLEEEFARE